MDHNSGYEKKDIPVRPVLIGGVIFILTVLGTIYMLYEYYIRVLDSTTYEFKLSKRSTNLEELNKFEQENLNSYKAKDGQENSYQIPIERSKEILLNEKKWYFSFYFSFTNKSCACPNSQKRISKRTANRCY